MLIRIEAVALPGRNLAPDRGEPAGRHDVHVAVQGRHGQDDLTGVTAADAAAAQWEIGCDVLRPPPDWDLRGPELHGRAGQRFIYLSWGELERGGSFTMFRRAKLMLDAVAPDVQAAAVERNVLLGRLGLTDERGQPLCAAVRPPAIIWSAPSAAGR